MGLDESLRDPFFIVQGVLKLVNFGIPEDEVWDMPFDKFTLYREGVLRIEAEMRYSAIMDTMAAIGGSLSGAKQAGDYLRSLEEMFGG